MIFQQWQAVLDGRKTQTRRIKKGDEWAANWRGRNVEFRGGEIAVICVGFGRAKWQVGRTYALQPGRGQPAIGRIRIVRIRRERVQDISEEDALAEGCEGLWCPVEGWHNLADNPGLTSFERDPRDHYAWLWNTIYDRPGVRWADNPAVWVLEFELVEEEAA